MISAYDIGELVGLMGTEASLVVGVPLVEGVIVDCVYVEDEGEDDEVEVVLEGPPRAARVLSRRLVSSMPPVYEIARFFFSMLGFRWCPVFADAVRGAVGNLVDVFGDEDEEDEGGEDDTMPFGEDDNDDDPCVNELARFFFCLSQ